MSNSNINKSFILFLRADNNIFSIGHWPIIGHNLDIRIRIWDDNLNLDEIESLMNKTFRTYEDRQIPNYIFPNREYDGAYIRNVTFPHKESNTSAFDFRLSCDAYLQAYDYKLALQALQKDTTIKIWSTESLGWSEFSYKVSDDIRFEVHTNFGYGDSSYFHLCFKYKETDILPLTLFIRYPYANVTELKTCTRAYVSKHESWNNCLKDAKNICEDAQKGNDDFVNKYIISEVDGLLVGLRNFMSSPEACVKSFYGRSRDTGQYFTEYSTVTYMTSQEQFIYSVYPSEVVNVIQAEKISGALGFIGKISAFQEFYPRAKDAINEIKSMAVNILPAINTNIEAAKSLLRDIDKEIKDTSLVLKDLKAASEPFEEEIKAKYNASIEKLNPGDEGIEFNKFRASYIDKCLEYKKLTDEIYKYTQKYSELNHTSFCRLNFLHRFEQCKHKIEIECKDEI